MDADALIRERGRVRKLLFVVVLGVLAWIFVVPSCSAEFGCEAIGAVAHADDHGCPSGINAAAGDAEWAASQFASIEDAKVTTGLFYDEDGTRHTFVSGEDDSERAAEVLADVGAPVSPIGTYPTAARRRRDAGAAVRGRTGMTLGVRRAWADLGVDRRAWVVSGVFQVDGATYEARFTGEAELARFVDFLLTAPGVPTASRLYLHPDVMPARPEHQLSTLRFQFDAVRGAAAAVLLVLDREQSTVMCWMSSGRAGGDDVVLAHDSWNQDETRFPPEAFITTTELRAAVLQWAFGETVPPSAVEWTEVPHDQIGWR